MASIDLSPQMAQQIFEGEGGMYYSWSSSKLPLLSEAKIGAGKLVLKPCGFALPHYSDSSKVGYVIQGTCGIVGMVLPNAPAEKVLKIKKGDTIPVPSGVVSWWYNGGDSELIVVFLGETSKAYVPGEFTYFLLTGAQGILSGFSTEFVSKAYDMNEDEANAVAKSQTGVLIVKLEEGTSMPCPVSGENNNKMTYNIDREVPDIDVAKAGAFTMLTPTKFPFLGEVGLSANHETLCPNAICTPIYTTDSTFQVTYVVGGSGRIQIVGIKGERILDTKVTAGHLFVVPRFFAVSKVADEEGLECFSIVTSSQPVFAEFGGALSVWKALSPSILQVSLNLNAELGEIFVSKIKESTILMPPKN